MRNLRFAVIFGVIAWMPVGVRAQIITQTFTLPTLAGYSPEDGTSISEFNPALGTLNSIIIDATATATWSGGGASDSNLALYILDIFSGIALTPSFTISNMGNGSNTGSLHFTDSLLLDLAQFTGSGGVATGIDVFNDGVTPASILSTFGTESVIYHYTPASVPEPSSVMLLGTVVASLAFIRYIRHSRKTKRIS